MTGGRRAWAEVRHKAPRRTLVVGGKIVQVSLRLWKRLEGHDLVPDGYACDGCSFSPDAWRGYKLWPACVIHDRHYDPDAALGGNWAGRWEADRCLRRNMRTLLREQGAPRLTAAVVPWVYWSQVRLYGTRAYFFEPGEHDESAWSRFREAFGLFRDRRSMPGVQPGFALRRELLKRGNTAPLPLRTTLTAASGATPQH